MKLGRIGVWSGTLTVATASDARAFAAEVESLGYDTLWFPEGLGTRESFTNAAVLLGATSKITVASGIANIWGRDAVTSANAARVLADAFGDRFLLGLGVSHPRQVDPRGHRYARPVATMAAYLDAMDDDPFVSPDSTSARRPPVRRVIAALRPAMLEVARDKADGAHSFLVPVEHTVRARAILGPDKLLIAEQKVVVDPDPASARATARSALAWYLDTPNYLDNLRWLGFGEDDLAGGGSDRLVDALVAWGDVETVAAKVEAHLVAGATQVALQSLGSADDPFGLDSLRALAPRLLAAARG